MINLAQVILLFLTGLAVVLVVLRYRQRRIGTIGFLLWMLLWLGGTVAILFPGSTIVIAHFLGVGRGADLVLYLGLILILYLLFRVYVRLEQMDKEITQIVRAAALREAGLGNSKDEPKVGSRPKDRSP